MPLDLKIALLLAISSSSIITGEGLRALLPTNANKLLIDGDSLIYRAAWATNGKPLNEAIVVLVGLMNSIINELDSDDYIFIIDNRPQGSCVRTQVFPIYKANRLGKPRPTNLDELKAFALDRYGVLSTYGLETDDDLADMMKAMRADDPICVSIDKDLLQITGFHYNYVSKKLQYVSPESADLFFSQQLIKGDTVDNIPGLSERRPKRRTIPLTVFEDYLREDWMDVILHFYNSKYGKDGMYIMMVNIYMLILGTNLRVDNMKLIQEYENEHFD